MQMADVTSKRADQGMIPKSMRSGSDPMCGNRFSEKIMPKKMATGLIQRSWIRP